ncbi:MAG: TonB-dependent receptor [Nitrococcus sp.]|nr:TonB-dependent receptor [Nitrococcus sp.]
MNLFTNFTFFLEDPVRGDQIEQADRRAYAGGNFSHLWFANWLGKPIANTVGVQVRHDQIFEVALFETDDREGLNTVRDDEVAETSVGVFFENEIQWVRKLRTVLGLRGDLYYFDVNSVVNEVNSGTETEVIFNPKLSVILGPWNDTEYYFNLGTGFHSNDARGVTTQVNPQTGEPTAPAPLVRSAGAELGVRTAAVPGLVSSLALWYLHLDSELVFVGDAGSTEAGPASERYGVEWNNFYRPRALDWLTLNLDVALTEARFAEGGGEIINSVGRVISAGATVELPGAWFGSVRVRHFGDRPLTEDGRIEAEATTLTNLRLGYEHETVELGLEVFNLFDAKVPDISYFYTTRLRGERRGGVEGALFHPVIPRTIRGYATFYF